MQVVLEILTGALAGNKLRLEPGRSLRLGRTSRADVAFPDDRQMSGVHFVVECGENECRIRDLKSRNGTLVNGERIDAALLRDGDQIAAGETQFALHIESETAAPGPDIAKGAAVGTLPEGSTPEERLLSMLRKDFQPLYAVLDGARSPNIYKLLLEAREEARNQPGEPGPQSNAPPKPQPPAAGALAGGAQYESLFEGQPKAELTLFSPYLVRLLPESKLLQNLVREGWGKSWGVYLTCGLAFTELRRHLRHFLMVKLPDGKQVYFRFYDPRVLRLFLPICLPEQFNEFFGPVKYYLAEDEKPEGLLRYSNKGLGVGVRQFLLAPPEPQPANGPVPGGSHDGQATPPLR